MPFLPRALNLDLCQRSLAANFELHVDRILDYLSVRKPLPSSFPLPFTRRPGALDSCQHNSGLIDRKFLGDSCVRKSTNHGQGRVLSRVLRSGPSALKDPEAVLGQFLPIFEHFWEHLGDYVVVHPLMMRKLN